MSPAPARGGGRRLIVLRHGETGHNAAGIWQGQLDVPLSDVGVAQADAAGPAVAALSPSRIVTSDLARARRTADSVGLATGIRVEVDARFREIHAGAWQGLTAEEVAQGWPELRAAALRGEDIRRGDDGETMGDVLARVGEALDQLLSDLPAGECAVVSTHGAAARAVASWVLDLDLAVAWRLLGGLGNCHWGELREGRHGWMLHTWNASSGVPSQAGSSPP